MSGIDDYGIKNLKYLNLLEFLSNYLLDYKDKPEMINSLAFFVDELCHYNDSELALDVLEDFLMSFKKSID